MPILTGPASDVTSDTERAIARIRSDVCNLILIGISIGAIPALSASVYRAFDIGWQPIFTAHVALAVVIWTITMARHRLPAAVRAGALIAFWLILSVVGYLSVGLASAGAVFALCAFVCGFLFFGRLVGFATLALVTVLPLAIYVARTRFDALKTIDQNFYDAAFSSWLNQEVAMLFVAGAIIVAMNLFGRYFTTALTGAAEARRKQVELFEAVPDGIIVVGRDGLIQKVNHSAEQIFGYGFGDLIGRPIETLVPDTLRMQHSGYRETMRRQTVPRLMAATRPDLMGRRRDGTLFPVSVRLNAFGTGALAATVAIVRDNSERAAMEAHLRHAQKMEAIGHLTGGIAHDFNNLIGVIAANLSLLEMQGAQSAKAPVLIERCLRAIDRGADLVQRLLAFSRRQVLAPQTTDVAVLIDSVRQLVGPALKSTIALETAVDPGVWRCIVDPAQLENALLNLCFNARDAMPDGGTIVIAANNAALDQNAAAAITAGGNDGALAPGDYVAISVTDTGTGIAPELIERVVEPFFTTKPEGQGTGLGLSMIYGFARQSGGGLDLVSTVGKGTTVTLYVPRVTSAMQ